MMRMLVFAWTTCFPYLLATVAWVPLECAWEAIWRTDVHSTHVSRLPCVTLQPISTVIRSEKGKMMTLSSEQVISKGN